MNSRTTIKFYLVIVGIVVIAGLIALATIYEEDIKKLGGAVEITFGISESSTPSEENMTFIASYETSIPFTESGIHNRIFIVHDNKRNVTCYIHQEGISFIILRKTI